MSNIHVYTFIDYTRTTFTHKVSMYLQEVRFWQKHCNVIHTTKSMIYIYKSEHCAVD